MYDPYSELSDDTVISLKKKNLEKIIDKAEIAARSNLLGEIKSRLGFSSRISFDDIPAIVKGWKEIAERPNPMTENKLTAEIARLQAELTEALTQIENRNNSIQLLDSKIDSLLADSRVYEIKIAGLKDTLRKGNRWLSPPEATGIDSVDAERATQYSKFCNLFDDAFHPPIGLGSAMVRVVDAAKAYEEMRATMVETYEETGSTSHFVAAECELRDAVKALIEMESK